jgi:hypothetical protein
MGVRRVLGAAVLDYLDLQSWHSWDLVVRFHYFLLFQATSAWFVPSLGNGGIRRPITPRDLKYF